MIASKAKRFLRTLSHATTEQILWRAVHVARMQVYKHLPPAGVLWLRPEPGAHATISHPSPLETTLVDNGAATSDLWLLGLVRYHGIEGSNRDWTAHDKSRLWQYERHYHTEIIALAAQDELSAIAELVEDWRTKCPALTGPSWEPYPMARRILNWTVALALRPQLESVLAPLLAPQIRHLARHLEKHLMGNHLLCDLFALVAGSSLMNAKGMRRIHTEALRQLRHHLPQQLLTDGGYAERTAQYHMVVLRDLLWTSAICKATGTDLELDDQARMMLRWARTVCRADGAFPWINDATADATPSLATIERLASQASIDWSVATRSSSPALLRETGWLIHRTQGHELLFDFGVIGPSDQPGHGHCDALHFELIWEGAPVVTDTGITTYAVGSSRSRERAASAHATVSVDGEGSDEVWASFRVAGRGKPTLGDVREEDGVLTICADCQSFEGWLHLRRLTFAPGRFLRVEDEVKGTREGAAVFTHIPLAPGWQLVGGFLECPLGGKRLPFDSSLPPLQESGWQSNGFENPIPRTVLAVPLKNGVASYEISLG